MSIKSKIADEEIRKYINEGKSNAQIAKALGTSQGNINARCNKIRKEYGELLPDPEPVKTEPLKFEDIQKDDRLMKDKKRLIVVAIGEQGLSVKNMLGQINFLHRKEFEKNIKQYTKVPSGDPQGSPVMVYHVEPESKQQVGDIKVGGKPIKDLPDKDKEKIVEHLKPARKPAVVNPEFEAAVKEMEAEHEARKEKVAKESAESVEDLLQSKSTDYIDPEWGVIPPGIENRILARANKEIAEARSVTDTLLKALVNGDRLPAALTERYNRIVSKYGEEVGDGVALVDSIASFSGCDKRYMAYDRPPGGDHHE